MAFGGEGSEIAAEGVEFDIMAIVIASVVCLTCLVLTVVGFCVLRRKLVANKDEKAVDPDSGEVYGTMTIASNIVKSQTLKRPKKGSGEAVTSTATPLGETPAGFTAAPPEDEYVASETEAAFL